MIGQILQGDPFAEMRINVVQTHIYTTGQVFVTEHEPHMSGEFQKHFIMDQFHIVLRFRMVQFPDEEIAQTEGLLGFKTLLYAYAGKDPGGDHHMVFQIQDRINGQNPDTAAVPETMLCDIFTNGGNIPVGGFMEEENLFLYVPVHFIFS